MIPGFEFEGRRAEVTEDVNGDVVIRCDRRTANYIAVRLGESSPVPVLAHIRARLDRILVR